MILIFEKKNKLKIFMSNKRKLFFDKCHLQNLIFFWFAFPLTWSISFVFIDKLAQIAKIFWFLKIAEGELA